MKCKKCQHDEDQHAHDETYKETERCCQGAVTGDSCECKAFEPKDKPLANVTERRGLVRTSSAQSLGGNDGGHRSQG